MQPVPHRQPFFAYPLAPIAGAFAGGILVAHFLTIPLRSFLIGCGLNSLLAAATLLFQRAGVATVFVTLAFAFAGAGLTSVERQTASSGGVKVLMEQGSISAGEPVELTGVLVAAPESAPGSLYLTMRVEQLAVRGVKKNSPGVVSLLAPVYGPVATAEYESLELRYGARIRVMTALKRADNFRNPGISSFTEYLERKGYDATGSIKSPLLIERLDDERVFLPLAALYEWRRKIETKIDSNFSPETAGNLKASLLGNRYYLSRASAERFRDGGTFHVLVISGWHISAIGGLAFLIARCFTKRRSWQFLLSAVVLWSYALAVGAEVSVVRAALMFTLMAFAPVVARKGAALNSLGAAALVLLVWRPSELFDPSFQLTFLSVLAIVVLAWPLLERMSKIGSWRPTRETPYPPKSAVWLTGLSESLFWREQEWKRELARLNYSFKLFKTPRAETLERYHLQRVLRYALGAFVVSLSVQLFLLPLLIVYFHRCSLSSLILNIGVSLLMTLLAITAVVGLLFAQVSSALATPLLSLSDLINWLMVHSVDPFARFGLSSLRVPEYSDGPAAIYGLYYVPLVILVLALSRWNPLSKPGTLENKRRRSVVVRSAALALGIASVTIIAHPLSAARADGRLRVDFLDVGQGDAALLTTPDGTTLLVDGGGRPTFSSKDQTSEDGEEPFERDTRSVGEAVVSEYLWWRGLDRVDYILATHADADHIDGLNDVAHNFKVGAALVARTPRDDPEFAKFAESLRAKAIPLNIIGAGDVIRFGGVTATVYWPLPSADTSAPSGNNESVVLQLRFGERTILMTGDVEKEGEAAIVNAHNELRSDVVKVPHHGSRTSSTDAFVAATKPSFGVFSVGQHSVFGHPHREVVDRWRTSGAQVLTTGRSGMITVTTDGRDLRVETFVRD